jgi:hypothetical protein
MSVMKKFKLLMVSFLFATCLAMPVSSQVGNQQRATGFAPPARPPLSVQKRVVFDSGPFSAGSVLPVWDKGYLISITPELTSPSSSNIRLYDATGNKVRESSIWFPGSERVFILKAAAMPGGNVIASGTAVKTDGTRAYFIAETDQTGKVVSALQTNPFFPAFICSTPDGKIWSFGDLERRKDGGSPEGGLVRQYDLEKGLVASYLPRSEFGSGSRPPSVRGGEGEEVYFGCASEQLVIYAGSLQEFVIFDLKSKSAEKYKIDRSSVSLPSQAFAVTSAGEVFAYLRDFSEATPLQGLFRLNINRMSSSVQWVPVDGASGLKDQVGVVNGLWGAEGDTLVYGRRDDPVGRTAVLWTSIRSGPND